MEVARCGSGAFRARLKHLCVPLAILAIGVALAGCDGGADDGATVAPRRDPATVAARLRHYFSTFSPEDSIFPYGAGPPRVKDSGCKYRRSGDLPPLRGPYRGGERVAFWQCSVSFESFTLPVAVAVDESSKVVWAAPVYGDSRNAPPLAPARTYTG